MEKEEGKFLQFLQVLYEFVYFRDLRAKAMEKPILAHERSYEFSLIQRGSESKSESCSESKSESESEKNLSPNQSLSKTKIRVSIRV